MKLALACLLASIGLALVSVTQAKDLRDKPGHLIDMRHRLGHLKDGTFHNLYMNYVAALEKEGIRSKRPEDDYRNYLPSGDECVLFFKSFRINSYNITNLEDFVVLDACLGYLYESENHEIDRSESSMLDEELDELINDGYLEAIYRGTQVDKLPEEAEECVGNLLWHNIQARKEHRDLVCHHDWIQVFLQFAECQTTNPDLQRLRDTDSYLKFIYQLVEDRAHDCFFNEIKTLNENLREKYIEGWVYRVKGKFTFRNPSRKQAKERMLTEPIVKLLLAVEGKRKGEFNVREVHKLIRGVAKNDTELINKFLQNMADYADRHKPARKSEQYKEDPRGIKTYEKLVDDLCLFFRRTDNPHYHDYATPFIRMVAMLEHEDIFKISKKTFVDYVLRRSHEISHLYLCVSSCNLLTFTEGAYVRHQGNGPLKFAVNFKPNTTEMVQWPELGYY